jgi:hypothetical protein
VASTDLVSAIFDMYKYIIGYIANRTSGTSVDARMLLLLASEIAARLD